jgi:hypothetical protein
VAPHPLAKTGVRPVASAHRETREPAVYPIFCIDFGAGGTVEVDGLHITLIYSNATELPLKVGDEIIGFFVKHGEGDLLRWHDRPFGLMRVRNGSVVAPNDEVARSRPLDHTNLAEVQADIQRLVARAAQSKIALSGRCAPATI